MLKEISRKLHLQLIIITHESELIDVADRAYLVEHNGRESKVTLTKRVKGNTQ
jgi:DNA repair exonuclease SbcCD ATPase subunit